MNSMGSFGVSLALPGPALEALLMTLFIVQILSW